MIEDDTDYNTDKTCIHPEHNPPKHIHIPQGKQLRHVCPACGHEVIVKPPYVTF